MSYTVYARDEEGTIIDQVNGDDPDNAQNLVVFLKNLYPGAYIDTREAQGSRIEDLRMYYKAEQIQSQDEGNLLDFVLIDFAESNVIFARSMGYVQWVDADSTPTRICVQMTFEHAQHNRVEVVFTWSEAKKCYVSEAFPQAFISWFSLSFRHRAGYEDMQIEYVEGSADSVEEHLGWSDMDDDRDIPF